MEDWRLFSAREKKSPGGTDALIAPRVPRDFAYA
jgi:hypothetical protein